MGHVNYIVVDSLKVKFRISRNIREDEVDDILNNISRIFEESENIDADVLTEKQHSPYAKSILNFIAYKFLTTIYASMDTYCFFDYMLIGWLKKNEIPYRIISEYALDKPAEKYIAIGE